MGGPRRHPGRQCRGHGGRQRSGRRGDAGPAGPDGGADRRHGRGPPSGGRPAGPGGEGPGRRGAAQRHRYPEGFRPHGRGGHYLREPSQRHLGCRRPGAEKRERLRTPGREGGLPVRMRHCGCPAGGPGGGWPSPGSGEPGPGHHPAVRPGAHDRRGTGGPADPPGRSGTDPVLRGKRPGALHPDWHRHLPHLCGQGRRGGHGAPHH